jgi:hypothetical protein
MDGVARLYPGSVEALVQRGCALFKDTADASRIAGACQKGPASSRPPGAAPEPKAPKGGPSDEAAVVPAGTAAP